MREILFRGKGTHGHKTGKWIYGNYAKDFWGKDRGGFSILPFDGGCYEVDPETIGQYTGLIDKNGTKIFEGDIVKIHYDSAIWGNNREVVFEEGQWFFKDNAKTQKSYIGAWGNSVVEVIGNIHDNPELLKELGK